MRQRKPKFELAIESPCAESWDNMSGTAARRHCASCQKHVYNFAIMTRRQIERTIADNEGHLCARITKRADGTLVTAQELASSSFASRAASLLLGAALSTAAAHGQSTPATGKAIVSGKYIPPRGSVQNALGSVIFTANGESVLETKTDIEGNWKAEIAPGTYDVIFKTGPIFGERVNEVRIHAGNQEFANVHGRFAYGHLGLTDTSSDTYTTMGAMVSTTTYHYPVSYFFKRPLRYLKHLPHNFS